MAKVFISYRRTDSATFTGRIYDRLVNKFGRKNVFKDVDDIPLGVHFAQYIQDSLRQCAAEVVVIGPQWLTARDAQGNRRLDDPADFVRIEIETALNLGLAVIPLLVDGAAMPASAGLPESLRPLALMNGLPVRNDPDFARDMDRVIAGVERAFASRPGVGLFGRRLASNSPRSPTTPAPQSQQSDSGADFGPPGRTEKSASTGSAGDAPVIAQAAPKVRVGSIKQPPQAAAEGKRSPGHWIRIRRPLIGGLAAIVVVASFALLFNVGLERSFFINTPPTKTASANNAAVQQQRDGIATATARARSLIVQFPYAAAAPGPGCDKGKLVWGMDPPDGTGRKCSTAYTTLAATSEACASNNCGSSSLTWSSSDQVAFPQPGKLGFTLSGYSVRTEDRNHSRKLVFELKTLTGHYYLNFMPDGKWTYSDYEPGEPSNERAGTYDPGGGVSVSLTVTDTQLTFVVGGKSFGPFSSTATIEVEYVTFRIEDDNTATHINLSDFVMDKA